jgi:hypothetical protein
MALLMEGPLTQKELEERSLAFASSVGGLGDAIAQELHFRGTSGRRAGKLDKKYDAKRGCDRLVGEGVIRVDDAGRYELTDEGRAAARTTAERMDAFLSPRAAARNTMVADFLLASMKLSVGILSGSAGMLADGLDATTDTASAAVVWVGVRIKKEVLGTLVVIAMMFAAACTIGYDSATKLVAALLGTLRPISDPYLVITAEVVAFISAVFLHLYQRAVGRRSGSLTLISQSVDSRNHVFVSSAVIIGAIFSIKGVFFIDALIGAFIALRFAWDGVGLSREARSSMRGEEVDLSKYRIPLEGSWHKGITEVLRKWILYSLSEENSLKREEMVSTLKRTFQQQYFPLMTAASPGATRFDFDVEFDPLVKPLLERRLVTDRGGEYRLTEEGRKWVRDSARTLRYLRYD